MPNSEVLRDEPFKEYLKCLAEYQRMPIDELIAEFNKYVRPAGIVGRLLNRMAALHKAFEQRKDIDFSAIVKGNTLSFAHTIRLEGKTIVIDKKEL